MFAHLKIEFHYQGSVQWTVHIRCVPVCIRAVESESRKKSKSRIKSEKSDLIFYQTFGQKSTSLMEMS